MPNFHSVNLESLNQSIVALQLLTFTASPIHSPPPRASHRSATFYPGNPPPRKPLPSRPPPGRRSKIILFVASSPRRPTFHRPHSYLGDPQPCTLYSLHDPHTFVVTPFGTQNLRKLQMFYLSLIEHSLRLPPHLLSLPLEEAIKGELENLFLDKVIAKLGLCVSVYDIKSIEGGFILPGDGASTYTVLFRLIMFRPFVGEIITGKLKESDASGLRLSLGFFDDILIPAHFMPNPSHHEPDPENKNQVRWIWAFEGENFLIHWTDEIKFQVHSVNYPSIPVEQPKDSKPFAPMVITGSLDFDGLGPVSWW